MLKDVVYKPAVVSLPFPKAILKPPPPQLERVVVDAADGGIGIHEVLGMRIREVRSCEVEAKNGVGWRRGRRICKWRRQPRWERVIGCQDLG